MNGVTRDAHVDDTEGYSAESAPGCTREGSWLSPRLSVVVDVFSRRVVGWSMATHLRTELVLEALNMAISQRRPQQVTHHSDQGMQYTVDRLRSALPGQVPGGSPHGRLRVHRGLLQPASQTLSPGLRLAHGVRKEARSDRLKCERETVHQSGATPVPASSGDPGDTETTTPRINVVLNWFEELKQRVPTGR